MYRIVGIRFFLLYLHNPHFLPLKRTHFFLICMPTKNIQLTPQGKKTDSKPVTRKNYHAKYAVKRIYFYDKTMIEKFAKIANKRGMSFNECMNLMTTIFVAKNEHVLTDKK